MSQWPARLESALDHDAWHAVCRVRLSVEVNSTAARIATGADLRTFAASLGIKDWKLPPFWTANVSSTLTVLQTRFPGFQLNPMLSEPSIHPDSPKPSIQIGSSRVDVFDYNKGPTEWKNGGAVMVIPNEKEDRAKILIAAAEKRAQIIIEEARKQAKEEGEILIRAALAKSQQKRLTT